MGVQNRLFFPSLVAGSFLHTKMRVPLSCFLFGQFILDFHISTQTISEVLFARFATQMVHVRIKLSKGEENLLVDFWKLTRPKWISVLPVPPLNSKLDVNGLFVCFRWCGRPARCCCEWSPSAPFSSTARWVLCNRRVSRVGRQAYNFARPFAPLISCQNFRHNGHCPM
jgi:hypothetical protein